MSLASKLTETASHLQSCAALESRRLVNLTRLFFFRFCYLRGIFTRSTAMIMHCVMCTGPDLFLPHTRTEPGMGQEGTWPDRRVRYVIIPYEFSYHFLNDNLI